MSKTKEIVVDFRRNKPRVEPLVINGEPVEIVDHYKYLGTLIDNQLDWSPNADMVCKKGNQRLFFLRKLRQFHVSPQILRLFYQSTIQSVLSFNQLCYHSSAKTTDMDRLERVVSKAASIVGEELVPVSTWFTGAARKKLSKIQKDDRHPLHQVLASQESRREASRVLRSFNARTNRLRDSFLPTAVRLFNEQRHKPNVKK